MSAWVCSGCGLSDDVVASLGRPSLDDRYAVGWCPRCAPLPPPDDPTDARRRERKRRPPAKTVALVRGDAWDPRVLRERLAREADRRLFERVHAGDARLTDADRARAAELRARWDAEAAARR
jgi:hypothetical protein